jgi:hypothetical protein
MSPCFCLQLGVCSNEEAHDPYMALQRCQHECSPAWHIFFIVAARLARAEAIMSLAQHFMNLRHFTCLDIPFRLPLQ